MKCFIHPAKESVAACRKCGKAMCVDCSSFSSHSGICPACRKNEMDKEISALKRESAAINRSLKTGLLITIFTFYLIVPILIYRAVRKKKNKELSIIADKIATINKSLNFVNEALNRGSGDLTVNTAPAPSDSDEAWQCTFCRTINQSGKTCKFCARKKP